MHEVQNERSSTVAATDGFTGPVFVVGMHRSGTKLVRDLLRGHPNIRISPVGTQFLPRWLKRWDRFGDLSDRDRFSAFYRWNLRAPYFLYKAKQPEGVIAEDVWYAECRTFSPSDVFEALVRYDVGAAHGTNLIWGDWSPDYVSNIDLLSTVFPDVRVIHVVRDGRDRCLSIKRRNGAILARAAQRWTDGVTKARNDGQRMAERYLEVRYEDLLLDHGEELRRCCELLGLEFNPSMLTLRFSTERTGDAKGAHEIVRDNARKYVRAMNPHSIHRIERIAGAALREFGYEVEYSGPIRRVPKPVMRLYELIDAINISRMYARRMGFIRNAQLQFGRLTRN